MLERMKNNVSVVLDPMVSPQTFGRGVVEALAHGVPVVGCNVGGTGEIVNEMVEKESEGDGLTAEYPRQRCASGNRGAGSLSAATAVAVLPRRSARIGLV